MSRTAILKEARNCAQSQHKGGKGYARLWAEATGAQTGTNKQQWKLAVEGLRRANETARPRQTERIGERKAKMAKSGWAERESSLHSWAVYVAPVNSGARNELKIWRECTCRGLSGPADDGHELARSLVKIRTNAWRCLGCGANLAPMDGDWATGLASRVYCFVIALGLRRWAG